MTMTQSRGGGGNQQQQLPPGALFRVPGISARPRMVEEVGPCQPATSTTLSSAAQTNAAYQKFQTLDIDRGFLLELDFVTTFTAGSGKTLTVGPFGIAQWIQVLQVQFESAYNTFNLNGPLAIIMAQYRSQMSPKSFTALAQSGASTVPVSQFYSGWQTTGASTFLATAAFALTVSTAGTQNTYSMFVEIPVSMYFDLYWELDATGNPVGAPVPRCWVSPQRMAATTRNVTPRLTFAPGLSSQPTSPTQSGPVSLASSDSTSTFSGTVKSTWWRDCWIPSQNPLTEPPNRMWQYSRDFFTWPTNGSAGPLPIPLDSQIPGQGQILSLVFYTYDPTASSSIGGVTGYAGYTLVELLYGSTVQIYQDTVNSNAYRWLLQHGTVLPTGVMGWDLAMTEDGRLTNEFAINTLVTAGTQLRITYASGSTPGSTALVVVGLEMLKKVGS
jgi:hypothetical protein